MLPGYLAIVMEYTNQGDLASFMSKFVLHNVRCQLSDITISVPHCIEHPATA